MSGIKCVRVHWNKRMPATQHPVSCLEREPLGMNGVEDVLGQAEPAAPNKRPGQSKQGHCGAVSGGLSVLLSPAFTPSRVVDRLPPMTSWSCIRSAAAAPAVLGQVLARVGRRAPRC